MYQYTLCEILSLLALGHMEAFLNEMTSVCYRAETLSMY
jgi:hypothetical protein